MANHIVFSYKNAQLKVEVALYATTVGKQIAPSKKLRYYIFIKNIRT